MYGAVDPVYMVMLIKLLGPDYVVWDKAATIRFRRPGRETLFAVFRITPADVAEIRRGVQETGKLERELSVDLVNAEGVVHASCNKLISVRARAASEPTAPARH